MMEIATVLEEYTARAPAHEAALHALKERLTALLRTEGMSGTVVSGRVKDADSLLRKAFRKGMHDPFAETADIVGARTVSSYQHECDQIAERLRQEFPGAAIDKKILNLGEEQLGYLGTHVLLPWSVDFGVLKTELTCEVQVRTAAEDAFARVAHDLIYKGALALAKPGERRKIWRLAAFSEVIDEEAERGYGAMNAAADARDRNVIQLLDKAFFRISGRPVTPDVTTMELVQLLNGTFSPSEGGGEIAALERFVDERKERLGHIFSQYADDRAHVLLQRPEILLIFERMEHAPSRLREAWQQSYFPQSMLTSLASVWGVRLPDA